jgi:hypothetical protein
MQNITEDKWIEDYKPKVNKTGTSGFDFGEGCCMYETYGDELQKIIATDNKYVWTLLVENNDWYILSGVHTVNRFGFFITEKPHNFENIEILIN